MLVVVVLSLYWVAIGLLPLNTSRLLLVAEFIPMPLNSVADFRPN